MSATAADVLEGRARWTVIEGDCLQVLPTLPDKSVAHVITDPPYASEIYERCKKNPARHDGKTSTGLLDMSRGKIGSIDAVLAPVSVEMGRATTRWALVFTDVEGVSLWRSELAASGLRYIRCGAWTKPDPMPQFSGDRPAQGFEACVIAHGPGRSRWNGGGHAALWHHPISKGVDRPDHPCPKPVELMIELVGLFTDPDEIVLDPFAGSGTTGVACLRLGRRFIGIEKDAKYAALARERLEAEVDGLSLRDARHGQIGLFGGGA